MVAEEVSVLRIGTHLSMTMLCQHLKKGCPFAVDHVDVCVLCLGFRCSSAHSCGSLSERAEEAHSNPTCVVNNPDY